MGKQPGVRPGDGAAFHEALARLRDQLPAGASTPPPPSSEPARASHSTPARAVVRIDRKGRRGKEATVVDKLDLTPDALLDWLDDLKRSLGCGGSLEGEAIVLQGDQRDRVRRWLEARGVRRVTVS